MEYYFIAYSDPDDPGVAVADAETKMPPSIDLIPYLRGKTEVPFDLRLKGIRLHKSGFDLVDDLSGVETMWQDLQPGPWTLMSERMKAVVDAHLTGKEGIVWMRVRVKSDTESRFYYFPRFERELDVLDEEKTLFVQGTRHIIKPVFSREKVADYAMFFKPKLSWEIPSGLYINGELKEAMEEAGLTGVEFEKTRVA